MDAAELTDIPLLAELSNEERVALAERMHELEVAAGTYVVQQGELSYKFYVILEGTAALDRQGEHLADLGPGDFFGEMGIVGHTRRNADVVATSPMRMAVLVAGSKGSQSNQALCSRLPTARAPSDQRQPRKAPNRDSRAPRSGDRRI